MKIINLTPSDDLGKEINALKSPAEIRLSEGVYRQKVEIKTDGVTLVGAGQGKTVITYDDCAKKIHADGREYNTFRTYTLCVTGENVRLENLTVENSNTDPKTAGQCVALSVNAKSFSAKNIELKSTQDTLFLYPFPDDLVVRYRGFIPRNQLYAEGRALHIFENCKISGTVDFIFGCSESYFKNCEIISLREDRGTGFIAAPAHPLAEQYGFNFIDCNLISDGAADGSVYLARPWRDFGKCAFINCRLGKHIHPALFDKWNDTERDKSARFLYYGLKCASAPAPVGWSKELSAAEAKEIITRCNDRIKDIIR